MLSLFLEISLGPEGSLRVCPDLFQLTSLFNNRVCLRKNSFRKQDLHSSGGIEDYLAEQNAVCIHVDFVSS